MERYILSIYTSSTDCIGDGKGNFRFVEGIEKQRWIG